MLALKVAYDGSRFHGSQSQPDVRTVHGEVAKALASLGETPTLRWAGRTDAGVSATGNVVAFESKLSTDTILPSLTFRMEDVWVWAVAEVHDAFEPRHATSRHYRFHLPSDVDAGHLQDAMAPFVGTHDFSSFARVEPGVDPVRTVHAIQVRRRDGFLLVDVRGESFLWNQVRRMVEAGRRVAAGEIPPTAITSALDEGKPRDLGTAPAEGLVLMDVAYERVAFEPAPPDVRRRIFSRLRRRLEGIECQRMVLGNLLAASED